MLLGVRRDGECLAVRRRRHGAVAVSAQKSDACRFVAFDHALEWMPKRIVLAD